MEELEHIMDQDATEQSEQQREKEEIPTSVWRHKIDSDEQGILVRMADVGVVGGA